MISFSVSRSIHTVIVVVMGAFLGEVCAGQSSSAWVKTLHVGDWPKFAKAVAPTEEGGVFVVGGCRWRDRYNQAQRQLDAFVSKYDAAGNSLWTMMFGGQRWDETTSVSATPDGGCVVVGYTMSHDGDFEGMTDGERDAFVLKIDASGRALYLKTLGGSGSDEALSVVATEDRGCCVIIKSGSMDGDFAGIQGLGLIKLNEDGDVTWKRQLPDNNSSASKMNPVLRKCFRGYIILCTYGKTEKTLMLEEFADKDGTPLWTRDIGGPNDQIVDVYGRKGGGCVVLTVRIKYKQENREKELSRTFKVEYYDSYGQIDLAHEGLGRFDMVTPGEYDRPNCIVVDKDENAIVSYSVDRNNGIFKNTQTRGEGDIGICSINKNGEILWVQRYGGSKYDDMRRIALLEDNSIVGIVVSKSHDGTFSGQPRVEHENMVFGDLSYLLKLDPAGQLFPPSKKVKKW